MNWLVVINSNAQNSVEVSVVEKEVGSMVMTLSGDDYLIESNVLTIKNNGKETGSLYLKECYEVRFTSMECVCEVVEFVSEVLGFDVT